MDAHMTKTISIIVPVYNAMPYLPACTKSILDQTFDNWELLLIDDGSTDESGAYCKQLSTTDTRIKVHHQENEGLVLTRQHGIQMATGDYILFVDADDEIELDLLERLNNIINDNKSDLILFGMVEDNLCETVKRDNHFESGYYSRERIEKEIIPEMITGDNFFTFHILPNLVCKCINRNWLMACKYHVSSNVTYGEDADFSYQILPQANNLNILDFYGYHYYKREKSMVGSLVETERIDSLERDLTGFLKMLSFEYDLLGQVKRYLSFARLVKCPNKLIDKDMFQTSRVALYGAGGFGQALRTLLCEKCVMQVDRNYEKYNGVLSPDKLITDTDTYDVVFVAIINASVCEAIIKEYKNFGVNKRFVYFDFLDGDAKPVFV